MIKSHPPVKKLYTNKNISTDFDDIRQYIQRGDDIMSSNSFYLNELKKLFPELPVIPVDNINEVYSQNCAIISNSFSFNDFKHMIEHIHPSSVLTYSKIFKPEDFSIMKEIHQVNEEDGDDITKYIPKSLKDFPTTVDRHNRHTIIIDASDLNDEIKDFKKHLNEVAYIRFKIITPFANFDYMYLEEWYKKFLFEKEDESLWCDSELNRSISQIKLAIQKSNEEWQRQERVEHIRQQKELQKVNSNILKLKTDISLKKLSSQKQLLTYVLQTVENAEGLYHDPDNQKSIDESIRKLFVILKKVS